MKVKTFENMFTQEATVRNLKVMAVWLLQNRIQMWFRSTDTFDCYKLNGTNTLDATGRAYHTRVNAALGRLSAMLLVVNDIEPAPEKAKRIASINKNFRARTASVPGAPPSSNNERLEDQHELLVKLGYEVNVNKRAMNLEKCEQAGLSPPLSLYIKLLADQTAEFAFQSNFAAMETVLSVKTVPSLDLPVTLQLVHTMATRTAQAQEFSEPKVLEEVKDMLGGPCTRQFTMFCKI